MPNIPAGAKKPSDRLKAEAENAGSELTFEFKGHSITVLPFLDWERHALAHINTLDLDKWAECAIHPDSVAEFKGISCTMREGLSFVRECAEAAGADLGELGASLQS